jgi:aspartate carbamoyltransferase catalytic subunit
MVIQADPRLAEPLERAPDTEGFERPLALQERIEENLVPLLDLTHRPVISARQFTREQLIQLCRLASKYETQSALNRRPLTGKILISAFYEPSTRTRLSFESAWHRLGGDIMSITDPSTTGIAKGESLHDVGEMLNHYGDLVVLRDTDERAVYEMLDALRIPIVNAGNGIDEHPTQALADIYAILKWRPELADDEVPEASRVRMGIVGVPSRMRTVRSLLILMRLLPNAFSEVVIICDHEEPFGEKQREELEAAGLVLRSSSSLEDELPELDIVYINSIAWVGDSFEEMGTKFCIKGDSPLKKGAIILHPLARGEELSTELDGTDHNWYFAQARGAVFVRMALLACLLKTFS